MTTQYILAIDQGTTTTRVLAFSLGGEILGLSQKEIKQYYPQNGWVEHDGEEIWDKTVECLSEVIQEQKKNNMQAIAVGITNQRETSLFWDRKTGKPVSRAIVWQDRRTADFCKSLKTSGFESMIGEKTGLVLDPYFSASKINWLLNEGGLRSKAEAGDIIVGTIESYLVYRLTGCKTHVTDLTNASRTMLCNIMTGKWDDDLLTLFDIPKDILPKITDNAGHFGVISNGLAGAGTPITGMIGDQQSAAMGQGCIRPGMVKSTYGTGCFVIENTGNTRHYSGNKLLSTVAYSLDGSISYALEGSIFNAGTVTQFLRDQMGFIKAAKDTDAICRSIEDTGGVYFVPAFTGLGAPHWDPNARAIITGLTRATTQAQIVRAGMESVAYQSNDLIKAFAADIGTHPALIRVDGGMSANDWLMQFLADILDVTIERPANTETTAYGAAIVAGIGAGIWKSLEEACQSWRLDSVFSPNINQDTRENLLFNWSKTIEICKVSK